jgi:hypothetical protein
MRKHRFLIAKSKHKGKNYSWRFVRCPDKYFEVSTEWIQVWSLRKLKNREMTYHKPMSPEVHLKVYDFITSNMKLPKYEENSSDLILEKFLNITQEEVDAFTLMTTINGRD